MMNPLIANPTSMERRVVMAKDIASRWLQDSVQAEFRLTVLGPTERLTSLLRVLRAFRNGKVRIGQVMPIRDLGILVTFDSVVLWSADSDGLKALNTWLEKAQYETTGAVW